MGSGGVLRRLRKGAIARFVGLLALAGLGLAVVPAFSGTFTAADTTSSTGSAPTVSAQVGSTTDTTGSTPVAATTTAPDGFGATAASAVTVAAGGQKSV